MNHEALASKAADAIGVTPHSDMRLYVEQAVKWALNEAALSAAEPVATVAEMGAGGVRVLMPHPPGSADHLPIGTKLYTDPPAPTVAVKALEWESPATGPDEYALITNTKIMEFRYEVRRCDGMKTTFTVTRSRDIQPFAWRDTIEGAKAAAQADYDARIRSALSAQGQDVAGWQSMDSAPKDGKHCLLAVKSGPFVYAVQGAYLMGEWGNAADIHSDPLCWMPLTRIPPVYLPWTDEFAAAAPAKQEGKP